MFNGEVIKLALLAVAMLCQPRSDAATTAAVKLCGRKLSDIMSRVCYAYNSPPYAHAYKPSVDRPGVVTRRKRHIGIADQCCTNGCTWEQLNEYCDISAHSEAPTAALEAHMIADRSAEGGGRAAGAGAGAGTPALVGGVRVLSGMPPGVGAGAGAAARREVGRGRSRGYGRTHGRRCWCRRKRRSGHRRASIGNMELLKNVARAAPVVGTVSPLLTWGRTLNTDLPPTEQHRSRYSYVVYT